MILKFALTSNLNMIAWTNAQSTMAKIFKMLGGKGKVITQPRLF